MKKTLSVFLSFVMLFTCLCVGGVSAQAAEKKTKITYLYEPETQTLYIRGKGAVPAYYLGWDECKNDDYNDKFTERDEYYGIVNESTSDGSYTIVDSSEIDYEILIRSIYPSFYIDTTRYVKKIVFEEGITSIGDGAFSYAFPKLEKVVFSSTITSIGGDVFCCDGGDTNNITVPATVKNLDSCAFSGVVKGNVVILGKSTKFVNIARAHYESIGRDIDIIKLNGSIELAPILGLSDVIVDIVETGTTLKENNLAVLEEFMPISARFIANKASYKFKYAQLTELLNKMKEALAK